MLTVGELKKKLEEFDDELPIVVYSDEDGDFAHKVRLEQKIKPILKKDEIGYEYEDDGLSYFKGDHPFEFEDVTKAVFICSEY